MCDNTDLLIYASDDFCCVGLSSHTESCAVVTRSAWTVMSDQLQHAMLLSTRVAVPYHDKGPWLHNSCDADVQVSAIVQRFYECLLHGDEYTDGCWEDWQNNHPADLAARGVQQGGAAGGAGGAGRGNCFK